jgi:O-antigen ligase
VGVLVKRDAGVPLVGEERNIARAFWAHRWRVRLIGFGTGMWYPMTKWPAMMRHGTFDPETKTLTGVVFLSAHNEYVETLFEQGIVGFLAAVGFVLYALHATWTGGVVGLAVLIPLMALLSIAFCNFPFTLFREVEKSHPAQPVQFVGCPAMLVMSVMILLLVEAVR